MSSSTPTADPSQLTELEAIAAASGEQRRRLVGDLLLRHREMIRMIAYRLCRSNNLDPARHLEDVVGEIHVAAVIMFNALTDAASLHNWQGMLVVRARRHVEQRIHAEYSALSGRTAVTRRQQLLRATQHHVLRETGQMLVGADLIAEHNRRMIAQRRDAKRQSVLGSTADLMPVQVDSFEDIYEMHDAEIAPPPNGSDWLMRHEATAAAKRTVARCYGRSEQLGRVAEMYLSAVLEGAAEVGNTEIAEALGIHRSSARTALRTVKRIAAEVLADHFGICLVDDEQVVSLNDRRAGQRPPVGAINPDSAA
jgi:hypothetical protein